MGIFGKSFEEQVNGALDELRTSIPGVISVAAKVEGKVVTLTGLTTTKEVRSHLMREFIAKVQPENTVNQMHTQEASPAAPAAVAAESPAPAAAVQPAATTRIHVVKSGDTLGAIAKHYYGNASKYMKIFEANRDQLSDPNKINIGQKLIIPD